MTYGNLKRDDDEDTASATSTFDALMLRLKKVFAEFNAAGLRIPDSMAGVAAALDDYKAACRALGLHEKRADQVLQQEMELCRGSLVITAEDAIKRAKQRIVREYSKG